MKIKIKNPTGLPHETRVVDALTGEVVENVKTVHFYHEASGMPMALLEIFMPELDVVVDEPIKVPSLPAPPTLAVPTISLNPDDIVVLRHPGHLSETAGGNLMNSFRRFLDSLGLKNPVLLLEEGVTMSVVQPEGKQND